MINLETLEDAAGYLRSEGWDEESDEVTAAIAEIGNLRAEAEVMKARIADFLDMMDHEV